KQQTWQGQQIWQCPVVHRSRISDASAAKALGPVGHELVASRRSSGKASVASADQFAKSSPRERGEDFGSDLLLQNGVGLCRRVLEGRLDILRLAEVDLLHCIGSDLRNLFPARNDRGKARVRQQRGKRSQIGVVDE